MIASDQRRVRRVFLAELVVLGLVLGTVADHGVAGYTVGPSSKASPPEDVANVDWASAQLVTVQLIDDRFVPDKFAFRRGVPYHLRLENSGADVHEFTAAEFSKTVTIRNPGVLEQGPHEVFPSPKEQEHLYFVARTPGHYRLTCANHDWDGMVGDITVV